MLGTFLTDSFRKEKEGIFRQEWFFVLRKLHLAKIALWCYTLKSDTVAILDYRNIISETIRQYFHIYIIYIKIKGGSTSLGDCLYLGCK